MRWHPTEEANDGRGTLVTWAPLTFSDSPLFFPGADTQVINDDLQESYHRKTKRIKEKQMEPSGFECSDSQTCSAWSLVLLVSELQEEYSCELSTSYPLSMKAPPRL